MKHLKLFIVPILLILFGCTDEFMDKSTNECIATVEGQTSVNNKKIVYLWGAKASVFEKDGKYIFQGDIVLDKEYVDSIQRTLSRGAYIDNGQWPNNLVNYEVNGFTSYQKEVIYDAIKTIEKNSYVDFVLNPTVKDRLSINEDYLEGMSGYTDNIGYNKNGVKMYIHNEFNYKTKGVIMHELCHALGLFHEQCRPDRDNYVTIDFNALGDCEGGDIHYQTYTNMGKRGYMVGEFDFNSIMLYDSKRVDFSGEDVIVMTKKDGSEITHNIDSLSSTDIKTLCASNPPIHYTFYEPFPNEGSLDSDRLYRRTKCLRAPEGAKIKFKLQYIFNPLESTLNEFTLDEFDVKMNVTIRNIKSGQLIYTYSKSLNYTEQYVDEYINIDLDPGYYRVYLSLEGEVNGVVTTDKLDVLTQIMYNPDAYLHLNEVLINGQNIEIPNDPQKYDANTRIKTYLAIQ